MARDRLCMDCRTVLDGDERCDTCAESSTLALSGVDPRHVIAQLSREERYPNRALERLWLVCFLAILVGIGAGTIWGVKAGHDALAGVCLFGGPVLLCAVLVAGMFSDRHVRRPVAATQRIAPPSEGEAHRGRVVGATRAALEVVVLATHDGGVVLADARTHGFVIAFDDGRSVRVPAGRVRAAIPMREDGSRALVLLDELGLRGLPYELASVGVVRPGVEVTLRARIDVPDVGSYREGAELRVIGVPWIEIDG